jgi:hypothetical protein
MIKEFASSFVEKFVTELNKDDNRKRLEKEIIDPVICYILDRLYPYIFITAIIFIILLILATLMIFLIIYKR